MVYLPLGASYDRNNIHDVLTMTYRDYRITVYQWAGEWFYRVIMPVTGDIIFDHYAVDKDAALNAGKSTVDKIISSQKEHLRSHVEEIEKEPRYNALLQYRSR